MVDQVSARVRTLVDGVLDRVFDEPFDVRSAAEFEDLVVAGPIGNGPGPAATSLGAFVAAATPLARRALLVATKSSKVATKAPMPSAKAFKIGLATIPIALRLTTTTRRGVRELQLLASYVISASTGRRSRPRSGSGALAHAVALRRSRAPTDPQRARLAHRRRSRPAVGAAIARWRRRKRHPGPRPTPGRGHRPPRPSGACGRLGPPRRDRRLRLKRR